MLRRTVVSLPIILIFMFFLTLNVWAAGPEDETEEIDPNFSSALKAIEAKEYYKALAYLKMVLKTSPQDADVLNLLGYSNRKLGNYIDGESYYLKALKVEPEHRGANEYLGELYLRVEKPKKAQERLKVLDAACSWGCEEYDQLKEAIDQYLKKSKEN